MNWLWAVSTYLLVDIISNDLKFEEISTYSTVLYLYLNKNWQNHLVVQSCVCPSPKRLREIKQRDTVHQWANIIQASRLIHAYLCLTRELFTPSWEFVSDAYFGYYVIRPVGASLAFSWVISLSLSEISFQIN